MLGDADLVRARQPLRLAADRQDPVRILRHLKPDKHRMVALVDVIHQAADIQPLRHRIAQRTDAGAFGQRPFNLHRQAGIARVLPVTVPTLLRVHDDRELDLAARPHRALGDQLGLDGIDSRLRGGGSRDQRQ